MIVLFTDFGTDGPYVGQMKLVLARHAPNCPVIDLMHDAPSRTPRAAAYLLAALMADVPAGAIVLGVVDPGVGGARPALAALAGDRWLVGPDNGLFELVLRRSPAPMRRWHLDIPETGVSASFHGRDVFAPAAARIAGALAAGENPAATVLEREAQPADDAPRAGPDWPDEAAEVIYIDGFGNAATGLRAETVAPDACIIPEGTGTALRRARTFCEVPPGTAFWYENAIGLVELAVNGGSAARALDLEIGTPVAVKDAAP